MLDTKPAVIVKGLYKTFKLPNEQTSGIKQSIVNYLKRKKGYEIQKVLDNVSFEIKKGEFFGIVGRNGSGKSTLLKLLADIYQPDKGSVEINGTLTPFIELGVGFNPELTGRENVYMNGALLGFNRKEVDKIYDDIVEFAEIEKFMDQKLKNYSSGMQVRLAFSIAIRAKSDILLFDEVLAVGDAAFQQKCYDTFETMKQSGTTIILVTHDMSAVQRFCERAILIDGGVITLEGNPSKIADRYLEENFDVKPKRKRKNESDQASNYSISNLIITKDGRQKTSFDLNENVEVSFDVSTDDVKAKYGIGFQIFGTDGQYVFGTNTKNAQVAPLSGSSNSVSIQLRQNLLPGTYFITLAIMNDQATRVFRYLPKQASFNIKQQTKVQGVVALADTWSVTREKSL